MRVVTFKLSDEVLESLDRLASRLGVSRSELIRTAIRLMLTSSSSGSGVRVREVRLR